MTGRRLSSIFAISLAVSGLCTFALSRKMNASVASPVRMEHYVAASKPLQAGETLKADDVKLVAWPADHTVSGAFGKPPDVIGRALIYPMEEGQLFTDKLLAVSGAGVGIAGRITAGMRAISLHSDEVMGVAGFIFPGSHVDVLVTYRTDKLPEPTTTTVLQDVEVVATGQKNQPDPDGKPQSVTVVTLLLSPEDAQRAVLASTQGAIHFVLRSSVDSSRMQEKPLGLSELAGISATRAQGTLARQGVLRTPRRTLAVRAPRMFQVETIAGDKQSVESFSGVQP